MFIIIIIVTALVYLETLFIIHQIFHFILILIINSPLVNNNKDHFFHARGFIYHQKYKFFHCALPLNGHFFPNKIFNEFLLLFTLIGLIFKFLL